MAKLRSQVVSRASCAVIAAELGLGERLLAAPPGPGRRASPRGSSSNRNVLAALLEAALAAIYLEHGFDAVAAPIVAAFDERDRVRAHPQGRPQDRAAGGACPPRHVGELRAARLRGPAARAHVHRRGARRRRRRPGSGTGGSKKDAEQEAAREALAGLETDASGRPPPPERQPRSSARAAADFAASRAPEGDQAPRVQVVRRPGRGAPRAGRRGRRRPERLGQVEHLRRDPLGDRLAEPARAARREARRRPLRRLRRPQAGRLLRGRADLRQRGRRLARACRSPRCRSRGGSIAAARASTSSTARAVRRLDLSSCSPTSASAAGCARSSRREASRRCSAPSRPSGARSSRRRPGSAGSSCAATGPS